MKTHEERLRQLLKQSEERAIERKLGLRLINIGYKALLANPPPNEYGYRWTMASLKRAYKRLRKVA
jgi:hypothetical protein